MIQNNTVPLNVRITSEMMVFLEEIAEEHYESNISRCIRGMIKKGMNDYGK